MAITYVGSATNPADNGSLGTGSPVVIGPSGVGTMNAGDLVTVWPSTKNATSALAMSALGGQSWEAVYSNNGKGLFWCRYNGTWSADPSVAVTTGTQGNQCQMHVFRPSNGANTWAFDNGSRDTYAAPSSPFTVGLQSIGAPINGTAAASNVYIGCWHSDDDNTWGSLAGTGWVVTGAAQYRNTSGTDQSTSYAHKIQTTDANPGAPTKNQATLGGDAGTTWWGCWYEIAGGLTLDLNDTANVADAITKNVSLAKSDSITPTDSPAKSTSTTKADSVTITDAISNKPNIAQADSVSVSDDHTKAANLGKADSVAASDAIAKSIATNQADSVIVSDAISKNPSLNQADSVGTSDAHSKGISLVQADAVSGSDAMNQAVSIVLSDTASVADQIVKALSLTQADAVVVSDAIQVAIQLLLSLSDTVSIADAISKAVGLSPEDTVIVNDVLVKNFSLLLEDIATANESITLQEAGILHLSDSVLVTDLLIKELDLHKEDSVVVVDDVVIETGGGGVVQAKPCDIPLLPRPSGGGIKKPVEQEAEPMNKINKINMNALIIVKSAVEVI